MKNVWVPGESVGDVPLSGTFEEYENAVGDRWVDDTLFEGGHIARALVDEEHDVRVTFHDGARLSFSAEKSLIHEGVQLYGRTPAELAAALGEGAEVYREPWVDEELVMVAHEGLGLTAFYYEPPYDTADSMALSGRPKG